MRKSVRAAVLCEICSLGLWLVFGGNPVASAAKPLDAPVNSARIMCQNGPGDAALIQDAMNSRPGVVLKGTCNLGTTTLTFGSHFFLGGDATLNYSGTGFVVTSSGNYNTIRGLTFNGGGVNLSLNDRTNWTGQYGWTIEGNRFQNITNGTTAVYVANIIGKGPTEDASSASSISHNRFYNIWLGGYPNFPAGYTADTCGTDCFLGNGAEGAVGSSGVWVQNGLDNVRINYNYFDSIGGNALKGFWDGFMGRKAPYTGHNIEMSHNVMVRVHRIGIEVQQAGQGNCPGGCDYSNNSADGVVFKDNFFHDPAFASDTFAYSFMVSGTNVQILNNTAVDENPDNYWPQGIAFENAMWGGLLQGNVMTSVYLRNVGNYNQFHAWSGKISSCCTNAGITNDYFNNFACGDGVTSTLVSLEPYNRATMNEKADYGAQTCPDNIASSNIALSFTSSRQPPPGAAFRTFQVGVRSTLSVEHVEFFLDKSSAPIETQEIQDFNPDFSKDPIWLYHVTIPSSRLRRGTHKITVVATDITGTKQTVAQKFDYRR